MNAPRENPFRHLGQWYWTDETDKTHGPYSTQRGALYWLLEHIAPSPWWERFARKVTDFVRA